MKKNKKKNLSVTHAEEFVIYSFKYHHGGESFILYKCALRCYCIVFVPTKKLYFILISNQSDDGVGRKYSQF